MRNVFKLLISVLFVGFSFLIATPSVDAVSPREFNPGRIIDDAIFYNNQAMGSAQGVQEFLNTHVPGCDTWGTGPSGYGNLTRAQYAQQMGWHGPPYACLQNYHENPATGETSFEKGGGAFAGGQSAAQIIWNAAQDYGINPQVLLVMLRKESAGPLTADNWPLKSQYKYAMGYACPDSGPNYSANCSAEKSGFYNQMRLAAWQLRYYANNIGTYNYQPNRTNYIQYNPDPTCGGKNVYIENMATASLYIYTPYVPNDAALDAYPGQANCGAYGNRNFFMMFNDWFGSTHLQLDLAYEIGDAAVDSNGDTAKIPVRLRQPPLSPVVFNFSTSEPALAKVIKNGSITFTPANWNQLQYVTVQGLEAASNSKNFDLFVAYINSPDGAYNQSVTPLLKRQPLFWSSYQERSIYRLQNPTTGKHGYAVGDVNRDSLMSSGFNLEGTIGYQCPATNNTPLVVQNDLGLVRNIDSSDIQDSEAAKPVIMFSNDIGARFTTLLRNADSTDSVISQSSAEVDSLVASGYVRLNSFLLCEATDKPMYRLYNPSKDTHFYTPLGQEAAALDNYGFRSEGLSHYLNASASQPVYRLYNPAKQTHFYTASASEKAAVEQLGFKYEGIAYSAEISGSQPVYRLYNPSKQTHFYTASASEKAAVEQLGFKYEGIAYYRY